VQLPLPPRRRVAQVLAEVGELGHGQNAPRIAPGIAQALRLGNQNVARRQSAGSCFVKTNPIGRRVTPAGSRFYMLAKVQVFRVLR